MPDLLVSRNTAMLISDEQTHKNKITLQLVTSNTYVTQNGAGFMTIFTCLAYKSPISSNILLVLSMAPVSPLNSIHTGMSATLSNILHNIHHHLFVQYYNSAANMDILQIRRAGQHGLI